MAYVIGGSQHRGQQELEHQCEAHPSQALHGLQGGGEGGWLQVENPTLALF